jgi:hypothetical protein
MTIVINRAVASQAGPIYIELDAAGDGLDAVYDVETRESPVEKVLDIARDVYGDGLDLARRCAEQAAKRFADVGEGLKPGEVELELVFRERGTLTAGHGARTMAHAIDCDCGGSAARS